MAGPNLRGISVERREATEAELRDLPHIVDRVPFVAWAAALVGAAERFGYYSTVITWQKYMQHDRGHPSVPGALGLGQSTASTISNVFFVFQFLTPLTFGLLSDAWLGRYRMLLLGLCLSLYSNLVMLTKSFPVALDHGAGLPRLISAMFLIAFGVGATKATISPFIDVSDQLPQSKPQIVRQKNVKLAVVDSSRTLQLSYNAFYWFTNIAALSSIPATFLERHVGFWTSYLMAKVSLAMATLLLALFGQTFRVSIAVARNGFSLNHAKQEYQQRARGIVVAWNDSLVEELMVGLHACRVIFSFAFFYLALTQMHNNLISQAGQMHLAGIPNDMIQAMSGVAIASSLVPIKRITVAYLICGGAMAYASGFQKLIYSTGLCYDVLLACDALENGRIPNHINMWAQLPVYVALAIAEILGLVTASQYSYSHAPKDLRSVVQAMVQLSACFGSVLSIAISPATRDPWLVTVYTSIAGAFAVCAALFWCIFCEHDGGLICQERE
ncbi:oligopeptide transporter [Setomelanomma holmii]|uniref:Oligopeptide transporter n=1 Tax=Setomelanomma holmii TaxID=210430 RepID=A0A9P4H2H0_9PLEO|nr:oligopeptide transporter [Setomelanomma holmii]